MAKTREQKVAEYGSIAGWEGYPYHLPDKPLPVGRVSYEEFLDWADEDTLAEWVDGEIIMASPASYDHQQIEQFLVKVLSDFAEVFDLGTIILAPFQQKLPTSGREPDLLFVKKEHLDRIRPTFLNGPADLAIEIVSKESQERDRVTKLGEYAEGKVLEYWLIDPTRQQAEFYLLDEQGVYQPVPLDAQSRYYSQILTGFWFQVDWLWRERLPSVTKVLSNIGGATYEEYLSRQLQDKEI